MSSRFPVPVCSLLLPLSMITDTVAIIRDKQGTGNGKRGTGDFAYFYPNSRKHYEFRADH